MYIHYELDRIFVVFGCRHSKFTYQFFDIGDVFIRAKHPDGKGNVNDFFLALRKCQFGSRRICARKTTDTKFCSTKIAGYDNYYVAKIVFFNRKEDRLAGGTVGFAIVAKRTSSPSAPKRYAKQLWVASKYSLRICSKNCSASSRVETFATEAINFEPLIFCSCREMVLQLYNRILCSYYKRE